MSLSGPMFEPPNSEFWKAIRCHACHSQRDGAHYNIFSIEGGIDALRSFFPYGEANDLNLVLFSTSGVHGSYTTLDDIEAGILKYGIAPEFDEWPDDYHGTSVTVLIIQPRIVCLRYGNVDIKSAEDLEFLKKLRESSWREFAQIGRGSEDDGERPQDVDVKTSGGVANKEEAEDQTPDGASV